MDGRILGTLFWAGLVNTVFLIFSLVRIFAAKEVRYGLFDLFNPKFYLANPIFIVLMIIGPITFISDLMDIVFRTEQISSRIWILLGFWFILVVSGTLTGTVIMSELAKQ
ncbi:hypothetical protein [[Eubacterium] cellulosolvens]